MPLRYVSTGRPVRVNHRTSKQGERVTFKTLKASIFLNDTSKYAKRISPVPIQPKICVNKNILDPFVN